MIRTSGKSSKFIPWVVIGVVLLLVLGGLLYVLYGQPKPALDNQMNASDIPAAVNQPSEQPSEPTNEQPQSTQTKPGEYTDYSQEYFDQTANSGRRVLFFHANWCPQCRALENDIKAQGVPSGMVIFKVNYDTAAELKQKYGVTLQTTLVEVDSSGNLVKKHVAYNEPTLSATLKALGN